MFRGLLSGCLGSADRQRKEVPLIATHNLQDKPKRWHLHKSEWHNQGVYGAYADACSLLPESDESFVLPQRIHSHAECKEQTRRPKQLPWSTSGPSARSNSASWSMDLEGSSSLAEGSMSFANVCPPFVHQLEGSSKGARLRVYANPLSGGIMEDTGATKPEGTTRGPDLSGWHGVRPQGETLEMPSFDPPLHSYTHPGFEDPIDAALDDVIGEANRGGFASPAGCTPGKVAGGSAAAVGTTPGPMSPHPSALSYPGTPKGQQPAALNDDQAFAARLLEQLQRLLEEVAADTAAAAHAAAAAVKGTRAAAAAAAVTAPGGSVAVVEDGGTRRSTAHGPPHPHEATQPYALPPAQPCAFLPCSMPTSTPTHPGASHHSMPPHAAAHPFHYHWVAPSFAWDPRSSPPWLCGWDPSAAGHTAPWDHPPPFSAAPCLPAPHMAAPQTPHMVAPQTPHMAAPQTPLAAPCVTPLTAFAPWAKPSFPPISPWPSVQSAGLAGTADASTPLQDGVTGPWGTQAGHPWLPPPHPPASHVSPYPTLPPALHHHCAPPGHAAGSQGCTPPVHQPAASHMLPPGCPLYSAAPAHPPLHPTAPFHDPTPAGATPEAGLHAGSLHSLQPLHSFAHTCAPSWPGSLPPSPTAHRPSVSLPCELMGMHQAHGSLFSPSTAADCVSTGAAAAAAAAAPTAAAAAAAAERPFRPPEVCLPSEPPLMDPLPLEPLLSPKPSAVSEPAHGLPALQACAQAAMPAAHTAHCLPPALAPIPRAPDMPELGLRQACQPAVQTAQAAQGAGDNVGPYAPIKQQLASPPGMHSSFRAEGASPWQHSPGQRYRHEPSKRSSSSSRGSGYVSPTLLSLNSKLDSLSGMAGGMAEKLRDHIASIGSSRPPIDASVSLSTLSSSDRYCAQAQCLGPSEREELGQRELSSFLELTMAHAQRIREMKDLGALQQKC